MHSDRPRIVPSRRALFLAAAALSIAVPRSAAAQLGFPTLADSTGRPPAQVMVLGVFHFHNPGADYAKFKGIDVLTPERQREIAAVVERLAAFAPTRIAVEHPPGVADSLNGLYRRYRDGAFELTRNETHQLGFRLAARLGHSQLFPVDYRLGFRMDSLLAYAAAHDPRVVQRFNDFIGRLVSLLDSLQRDATIGDNLRFLNDPANIVRGHEPYVWMATLGAGDNYVGARMVAEWYERNLAMFANLARVAPRGERVLLIVGSGHSAILRDLVTAHPDMALVEAADYLR